MGSPYNHRGWPKDGPKDIGGNVCVAMALYTPLSSMIAMYVLPVYGPNDTMLDSGCKIVDNLI